MKKDNSEAAVSHVPLGTPGNHEKSVISVGAASSRDELFEAVMEKAGSRSRITSHDGLSYAR